MKDAAWRDLVGALAVNWMGWAVSGNNTLFTKCSLMFSYEDDLLENAMTSIFDAQS